MALDATADSEKWASQALACTIQGNASDVFKHALLRLRTALPPDVRLLFPHHDSILFDAPFELLNDACQQIREVMEAPPVDWPTRFPVKVRCGQNWGHCTAAGDGLDSDRQEPSGSPAE